MKPSLGEFLKKRIAEIPKMSIRNLERKSGVSNSEICKIINGSRKNPNPHMLKLIAQHLKVDYKFLYYLAGYIDDNDWERIEKEKKEHPEVYDREREKVAEGVSTCPIILSSEEHELLEGFRSITDHEVISDILKHLRLALKAEGRLLKE